MIATSELLGIGLYTTEEAAHYARVSTRTTNRWMFGEGSSEPVVRAQLGEMGSRERLVTFLDFVQLMAIRSVRLREKRFPLPKIRNACDRASRDYGLRFPLAAKDHRILLFGPRDNLSLCEMIIEFGKDSIGEERYLQVTGKNKGNLFLTRVAEPFIHGLEFGEGPFATRYIAWKEGDKSIVMDPHQRLGEPYLPWCGYTASGIWDAYVAEGGVKEAANVFGISETDVELVVHYYDFLAGTDAA